MKLLINAKCSDMCQTTVYDDDGNILIDQDDYAPSIDGIGGGDYIDFEVDVDTGKIIGWNKDQFLKWFHANR